MNDKNGENNEIIKKVRGRPVGSIQKVKEIKIKFVNYVM